MPGLPINDVVIEARGREAIRLGTTVVALDLVVLKANPLDSIRNIRLNTAAFIESNA